ncbi:DoxX family membrane protein [Halobaculum sp. WSA2]|uniref:DoxX family membrane protein n=1 Tax=Halobaculum saliterrae TaxID=2073113 RepID=A0A6B0T344_9EURY|nr:DoxX family membrane protein [Halobaculum saliterrae]MXR42720.1 DoxX family membrane protein [Halobaculum saliterrae]
MRSRSRNAVVASVAHVGALVAVIAGASGLAAAHVEYVTDGEGGDPIAFMAAALSEPIVVLALGGGGVAVVGTMAAYLRVQPLRSDISVIRRALTDYTDLLPWLLRLGIGLPMVGAGFAGYLFTPLVTAADTGVPVRLFGVAVGFALLFGLATRFVAGAALVSYLVLLPIHPSMFFAFEYVAGLLAIVLVGGGRPSADHVIARMAANEETVYSRYDPFYREIAVPVGSRLDEYRRYVPTIVRVGMGIVFMYLALAEKLLAPDQALAVVEQYGLSTLVPVPPELWVLGAAVTELFLGVLLVLGLFTRAASASAFFVFTTTLFGLADDPVLAHISLFGLVSVLLVTGAGPFSIDTAVFRAPNERGEPGIGSDAVRTAASSAGDVSGSVLGDDDR